MDWRGLATRGLSSGGNTAALRVVSGDGERGLGKSGNVGLPEGFTASLRVEGGEQSTTELWPSFGGQRCSVERARARRSELAMAPPL